MLVPDEFFKHSDNLEHLRILPDVRTVEGAMSPRIVVIVREPSLLDGSLVLLLLCEAQKFLPVSCLDFYFFCHNSNILVISAPLGDHNSCKL